MELDLIDAARAKFPYAGTGPCDVLAGRVARNPDLIALIDYRDSRITNKELWSLVSSIAKNLSDSGIQSHSVVAVIGKNSIDYVATMFAVWALGAIFVPFDPEQPAASIARSLELIRPSHLVADPVSWDGDAAALVELAVYDEAVYLDITKLRAEEDSTCIFPHEDQWVRGQEIAALYLSSGTTGKSKACMMPADYLLWAGEEFSRAAELNSDDLVLTLGSFAHVNAIWALMGSLVNGTTHAFEQKFSLSRFWERIRATRATVFDYVGTIISLLLKQTAAIETADLAPRAGIGGAAHKQEVIEFEKRFGVPLLECYGLTECVLPIFQRKDERKVGSIGLLSEYFDSAIVDGEGAQVTENTTGVLRLRPKHRRAIFAGYWHDDASTQAAFDDEWFITGDRVSRDDEGYFIFHGRSGQVIRRRGVNLSIDEIEAVVRDYGQVKNCAAFGIPSPLSEEDLVLFVVPSSQPFDVSGFVSWLRTQVASGMMPDYLQLVPKLPMTSSERVQRTEIAGLLDRNELLAIQPTALTQRKGFQ